jgi:hypothetical protein
MDQRAAEGPAGGFRRFELASILLFTLAAVAVLVAYSASSRVPQPVVVESDQVFAQASAMPDQGWAPLSVLFSAYGSHAEGAPLARIEWDLDANGEYDYDATNQGGYAAYVYSKPGNYAINLRVTDSLGRSATDQITVSVRLRASSSVDYWTVFDDRRVGRIEVRLSQADWDQMWADPESKHQARADATIFGETLRDVGFRMRGQFSLRESGIKKPWKIDTDAYVDGQEFHNLRQLLLLNAIGDPTLLKEKLAYEMMAFAGLPASHVAFVELWIDIADDSGAALYWGIYALAERVDLKFLANRFGQASKGGNLYKASHAQRGPMDLVYYGEQIEDYPTQDGKVAYGKMNNEEEADYSDIIALCRVLDGTDYASEDEFRRALESVLNVDDFLRYLAVSVILDNWDSYPYTGNNYYLFNNPVSNRFEWIPWDLTWGENAQAPPFQRSGPTLAQRAPLYDRVLQVKQYRSQYAAYLDLLLRGWFNPRNIADLAGRYHRLIAPYVTQSTGDKAFFGDQPMYPFPAFQDGWRRLVDFATQRTGYLRSVLAVTTGMTPAPETR